ncbi:hypothetical protein [Candidatus Chromulinivorax destructor]|uniref:Uncharacterized protein n=1 Tax=Candidatus Chromulinivorax destructor TaxID=2066483 RepID=A0A345ZCI9_9BACT|nr:hypothetical protein [Candidatus Chromulinivorax destructor]AXK61006.1 hypothetical protein C0J27_04715 [Candidatus Chromulinivorax destructor]
MNWYIKFLRVHVWLAMLSLTLASCVQAHENLLGTFDCTYGVDGVSTVYAGEASVGQQIRAIAPLSTGTKIMAVVQDVDGLSSWTVRLLSDGTPDPTYTIGGQGHGIAIAQISGTEVVHGMVFDGAENSIVFGSNCNAGGYIKSVMPTGAMNRSFGCNRIAGTVYLSQIDVVNAVAQLSNGNYIFVGCKGDIGMIGMLNCKGVLVTNFGTASGFIPVGTNVTSVCVDADDSIYVAISTVTDEQAHASVAKYNLEGVLVQDFGVDGVACQVLTNIQHGAHIAMVIDAAKNIVIATSGNEEQGSVCLVRLNQDGLVDTNFHDGVSLQIECAGVKTAVVTNLVALQNIMDSSCSHYLVAGHQLHPDYQFVAAVTPEGNLDQEFYAAGLTPGIHAFYVASGQQVVRNLWGISVQDNGQILVAASEESTHALDTPLTIRINGYHKTRAVPQYIGKVIPLPDRVNHDFGINGIGYADTSSLFIDGGDTVIDGQGRILVSGITTSQTMLVARFLPDGTPDYTFGGVGYSQTPIIPGLTGNCYVAVDSLHNVYVASCVAQRFVVARFVAADGLLDSVGFNGAGDGTGVAGLAQTDCIETLITGGYLAVDAADRIVIGGHTCDGRVIVARFTTLGTVDIFGTAGIAQTTVIPTLRSGGNLVTDADNNVYVGASTFTGNLVVGKFDAAGNFDTTSFANSGVAKTLPIMNLADGGSLAFDSLQRIVIGGYTTDKTFVVGRFTITGIVDDTFGHGGIAVSHGLTGLYACKNIAIDGSDAILIAGTLPSVNELTNQMVIARFTSTGGIDTTFTSTGIAIIDTISLSSAATACVAVNKINYPLISGCDGNQLMVTQIYSGDQIMIKSPDALQGAALSMYWYGNNPTIFKNFFNIPFHACAITDVAARSATITAVHNCLDEYAAVYANQLHLNLVASTTPGWDRQFALVQQKLTQDYPDSADNIHTFFTNFNACRIAIRKTLLGCVNQM